MSTERQCEKFKSVLVKTFKDIGPFLDPASEPATTQLFNQFVESIRAKTSPIDRPLILAPKPPIPPGSELEQFFGECFTYCPGSSVYMVHVKARYQLWIMRHLKRAETEIVDLFNEYFNVTHVFESQYNTKLATVHGIKMNDLNINIDDNNNNDDDVAHFFNECCIVHVMGRALNNDICADYHAWKLAHKIAPSSSDKQQVLAFLAKHFVKYERVAVKKDGVGGPGWYGFYLASASDETRSLGYKKGTGRQA